MYGLHNYQIMWFADIKPLMWMYLPLWVCYISLAFCLRNIQFCNIMYTSLIPSDRISKLFCLVKELKASIVICWFVDNEEKVPTELSISRAHFNVTKLVSLTLKKKKKGFHILIFLSWKISKLNGWTELNCLILRSLVNWSV